MEDIKLLRRKQLVNLIDECKEHNITVSPNIMYQKVRGGYVPTPSYYYSFDEFVADGGEAVCFMGLMMMIDIPAEPRFVPHQFMGYSAVTYWLGLDRVLRTDAWLELQTSYSPDKIIDLLRKSIVGV